MPNLEATSLRHVPLSETLVRQMYTPACTPFELSAFQHQWQQFGWVPAPYDEYGFNVSIDKELVLGVAPNGNRVDCAILPFCYWEKYEEEQHDAKESFQQEKRAFDAVYENAYAGIEQALGSPRSAGYDKDDQAHRYAIWQGDAALFILQQAAYDVQFGLEIHIWLEPGTKGEFVPTVPLIDWLTRRHLPPA